MSLSVSVVKCNGYDVIGYNNEDGEWLSYDQFEAAASTSPDCAAALLISMNNKNEKDRAIELWKQLPIELGVPVLNALLPKHRSYVEELRKLRKEPIPMPIEHEMGHWYLNTMKFSFSLEPGVYEEPCVYEENDNPQEPTPLCREMLDPLTEGVERYLCDNSAAYLAELEKQQHLEDLSGWGEPSLSDDALEFADPSVFSLPRTMPEPSFLANTMARGANPTSAIRG